jgi:hypothetical protein
MLQQGSIDGKSGATPPFDAASKARSWQSRIERSDGLSSADADAHERLVPQAAIHGIPRHI